jgi:hypothetical protein
MAMSRVAPALAVLLVALIACTEPGGATDGTRTDTLAPTSGAPGTSVEVTGRFPADAALHLCNVPLADLNLDAPETILIAPGIHTNTDVRTRATGRVPTLTPGSTCALTIVRDGQTLPNAGTTLTFTTDPTPPDAPTNLTATPRNASLAIAFTIANDGGSPTTTIESSLDDGTTWTQAPTPTSPLLLHDLTNDQPYSVRLRATNAAGTSPASEPIHATPTLWSYATSAGGVIKDAAFGVSALGDGSAIVTGTFSGTADFGPDVLPLNSAGSDDVFVAKILPDGTWAWATRAGGVGIDVARGVSVLSDGSAIVTGYFGGTASFGPNTLTSAGSADVFVAKISTDGTWAWATRAGGSYFDAATGVSALSDGSAIVTGPFEDTATFGPNTLISASVPGVYDVFVAKISAEGDWAWATRAGGTGQDFARGVSALSDGSAIVTGSFTFTASFGPSTLTSVGIDAFVAKISAEGDWAWATRADGSSFDSATGVTTLSDGSAIVTGTFAGTATFGPDTLTSAGNDDIFVAKISAYGDWAWATRAGGIGLDDAGGVSALSDGSAMWRWWALRGSNPRPSDYESPALTD